LHGDYETSESLAEVLNHIARHANTADAIHFADDGVFDATEPRGSPRRYEPRLEGER
jgi:hypothetical protein